MKSRSIVPPQGSSVYTLDAYLHRKKLLRATPVRDLAIRGYAEGGQTTATSVMKNVDPEITEDTFLLWFPLLRQFIVHVA